jgi:hypothetical protein
MAIYPSEDPHRLEFNFLNGCKIPSYLFYLFCFYLKLRKVIYLDLIFCYFNLWIKVVLQIFPWLLH